MAARRPAKFVQLMRRYSTDLKEDELYALDAAGRVWVLLYGDPPTRWCEVSGQREALDAAETE